MLRLLLPLLLLSLVQSATLLGEKKSAKGENDELHQELANKAVDQINAESNDLYRWELASVDDVHKQMVAGVKYTIQMSLVKTDCTKQASQLARTDCAQGNQIKKCTAEVVHKAWESSHSVNVIGCEEPTMRTRRHTSRRSIRVKRTFVMEELRNSHHVKPKDYVHWNQFSDFVDRHDRVYETKRVALKKFRIFKKNMKMARFYQEQEQGTAVYGVTQFSDMTSSEWKKTYLPYVWDQPVYPNRLMDESELIDNGDIPDSFDWRQHGAVTGVKNQGNCGSCWAFSTTGNVEGQWFLAKKKLVSLAEQQLVDCDSLDQGCNGGLPSNAYKEIIRMGGLEPEDKYPYDGKGETCHITRKEFAVFINGSVELPHNEESMKLFIAKKGPVSIGINANPLQFYRHGVSHPWKILCEPFMLNHGVLIVGYGTEKNKPYWIIKNSWGPTWGESGYYRLYRGKNVCGVREMATSAIIN